MKKRTLDLSIAAGLLGLGALRLISRGRNRSLAGKRVLITGGSRGLGLALARQYARQGASLVLCARDREELERAKSEFLPAGTEVETHVCDITDPVQVRSFVRAATFGARPIDVLINNAGIIDVGPLDALDMRAFEETARINLFGMIRVTLEALPHLRAGSRIVNISSIGGTVAVPHLLPYCVSKFGALGFSLGLDAELASRRIVVTSVLPGLMRTGSFVQARFHGAADKEFGWFALGATLPGLTLSAEQAAKGILEASQSGRRFVVLGPQAKALRQLFVLAPEPVLALMRLVSRLLPAAGMAPVLEPVQGKRLTAPGPLGRIVRRGSRDGDRLNQTAA